MKVKMRKWVALFCALTVFCSGSTASFAMTNMDAAVPSSFEKMTHESGEINDATTASDFDVAGTDVLMTTAWDYFNPKDKSDLTEILSLYSFTDLYVDSYGGQLTEVQKAYYDAMRDALLDEQNMPVVNPNQDLSLNVTEKIYIPYLLDENGFPATDENGYAVLTEEGNATLDEIYLDLGYAYFALTHDYPQLFWAGGVRYSVRLGASDKEGSFMVSNLSVEVKESYDGAIDKIEAYRAGVTDAVTQIENTLKSSDGNKDSYFALREIHDYLCEKISYNYDALDSPSLHMDAHSSGPVFYQSKASVVCEGYGEAFKVLCDAFDIPCALIVGKGHNEAHLWNYVQIDGIWYMVDVTWDDEETGFSYDYFLIGGEGLTSHVEMNTRFSTNERIAFDYPDLNGSGFRKDVAEVEITLSDDYFYYTGEAISPKVTCEDLEIGEDYTLTYKNNTQPGTATVEITGKGFYQGTATKTFKIAKLSYVVNDDGKSCTITSAPYTDREKVTIPAYIDGYKVTDFYNGVFYPFQETLEFVQLPDHLKTINSSLIEPYHMGRLIFHCYKDTMTAETLAASGLNYVCIDGGEENLVSGTRGNNVSWKLDKYTCELTIETTGDMPSFSNNVAPWKTYTPFVKHCEIKGTASNIGASAFNDCDNLKDITMSDSVKTIGDGAFYSCQRLKTVQLSDKVTSIGNSAFSDCESLETIDLGINLKTLGPNAFFNCRALTEITIPEGVTLIDMYAFMNCESLCSVTLPESLKDIGSSAFAQCYVLSDVHFPEGLQYIGSGTFANCDLYEVVIPVSVNHLGSYAFGGNQNLGSIMILNRNLELYSGVLNSSDCTIFGYTGTSAEKYATENGYVFESLDAGHTHTFGDWEVDIAATCEIEGSKHRECSGCRLIETEPIKMTDHQPMEWMIINEATCTTEGLKVRGCSTCTGYYEEDIIPALEHDYGEWVITQEPSCMTEGSRYKECSRACMESVFTESIPALDHTEKIIPGKAATCTEDGLTDGKACEVCGDIIVGQKTIPSKGHTEVIVPGKGATCIEDGLTDGRKCEVCGIPTGSQVIIPAKGHTEKIVPGKAATCTEDGLTDGKWCEVCEMMTVEQKVDPAKGHKETTLAGKAATCTQSGKTEGKECTVCGTITVSQQMIAAKGHKLKTLSGKAATCTATGLTTGKQCIVCKTITVKQRIIGKLAHKYESIVTKATTSKNGKLVKKCDCGKVYSTTIIRKASKISLSKTEYTYTGKVLKSPTITVKDSAGKTIAKSNYIISKPSKSLKTVGKYTYTIKFKGNYSGTKKLSVTIKPKTTAIKSVTAAKNGFTVKWTKVSKEATGYEIMYATNSKFTKGKKTVKATSYKTISKKVTKLKAKTKYYVKVRTYKTVNGVNYYSNWSKYKTIKTK